MNLRILSLAYGDLEAGRDFYEMQQEGLGTYFLDTLFSDIESLLLHAGAHLRYSAFTVPYRNGFLTPSTTRSTET